MTPRTMMPRTGPQLGRVKKLARAGMWIAVTAELTLLSVSTGWVWVATGCAAAFGALSVIAAILELRAEGRWRGVWRKGSGLSGRGRDGDGAAGEAVRRRPALAVVSRLMPGAARPSAATCGRRPGWR